MKILLSILALMLLISAVMMSEDRESVQLTQVKWQQLTDKAEEFERSGSLAFAIDYHKEALFVANLHDNQPAIWHSLYRLAALNHRSGKANLALEYLSYGIERRPNQDVLAAMHQLRARVYEEMGLFDQSEADLDIAFERLSNGPENDETKRAMAAILAQKATLYLSQQASNKALDAINLALAEVSSIEPGYITYDLLILKAKVMAKLGASSEAEEILTMVLAQHNEDVLVRSRVKYQLAEIYQSSKQLSRAVPLLEQSLTNLSQQLGWLHPNTYTVGVRLADIYLQMEDLSRSRQVLVNLLQGIKSSENNQYQTLEAQLSQKLAMIYMKQKAYPEAKSLLHFAADVYETSSQHQREFEYALQQLGLIYQAMGANEIGLKMEAQAELHHQLVL